MIRENARPDRRAARLVHRAASLLRAAQVSLQRPGLAGRRNAPAGLASPGTAQSPARPRQLRPIVVPASLDELHGPSSGLVTPPRRLCWSGEEGTAFDLGDRGQAAELYEAVFEAARTHRDIAGHLDPELLVELWPELGMRRVIRQAWEAAHPVLAAAAASSPAA